MTGVPCALCGGPCGTTLEFGPPALRRCERCGSCFAIADAAAAVATYGDDRYLSEGRDEIQHDETQRAYEARVRVAWLERLGLRDGALLEIGSAGGAFLGAARDAGFRVRGVEPSPTLSRSARDRLGVDVVTGLVEDLDGDADADVVCAWHALEHAADPVAFLAAAQRRLRPGGRLVLEVPNVGSPVAARLGRRWPALADRSHLTHFTPAGLRAALGRSGFTPDVVATLPRWRYRRPSRLLLPRAAASLVRDAWCARGLVRDGDPARGDLLRAAATRRD